MEGCALVISDVEKDYRVGTLEVSWNKDSPDQIQVLLDSDQPTGLPQVEEVVKLYTRDGQLLFIGTVNEVGREGIYRGSSHLSVPLRVLGLNLRMYDRVTRDRLTGDIPVWRSVSSTVDVAGTAVTRTAGDRFDISLVGKTVKIATVDYTVASVEDPDHLTLGASGGTTSGSAFEYEVYSGDVVKELIDDAGLYMTADGLTYSVDSISQGAKIDDLFWDPPVSIAEAVSDLLELNPTFGAWLDYTTASGNIFHFQEKVTTPAPVDLTDLSGKWRQDVSLAVSREDVRNVEISVLDPVVLVTTKKSLAMDGTTKSWLLDRPVGTMVRMYFGTADNQLAVVFGEEDTDSAFMYHKGSCAVWQNDSDPAHAVEDGPLTVEYYPLGDNLQECLDSTDITRRSLLGAFSGRVEAVVDRSKSPGQVEAFNEATGSIARLKDDLQKLRITTWEVGLRPGQIANVQSAKLGIGTLETPAQFYIDKVTATDKGFEGTAHDLLYTLETVAAARHISAAEVFRGFGGGSGSTINGAGGGKGSGDSGTSHFDRTLLVKNATSGLDKTDHVVIYGGVPGEVCKFIRLTGVLRVAVTTDLTVKFHLKYVNEDHILGTFTIPSTQAVDDPISWLATDAVFVTKLAPDASVVYGDILEGDNSKDVNGIASFTIEYGSKGLPDVMASQGIPVGGTTGQALIKQSGADFDADWDDVTIPDFVGDSGAGGESGVVPAPAAGDTAAGKFLKSSGGWEVIPDPVIPHGFGASFDGAGSALTAGMTAYVTVPNGGTIGAWNILVDTGTCTIKVWKAARGTAIPTASDSISTSGVAIASGTAVHSTTLTDFTTLAVVDGDLIAVHLEVVSGATQVNFSVELT